MNHPLFNSGAVALLTASIFCLAAQAQDAFTNGLVAHYPFATNANDASGNGNNGAIIGYDWNYSSDRFGEQNSLYLNTTSSPAFDLDGAYMVAPRSPSLDFNQDFTVSAWVNVHPGPDHYVHNVVSNGPDTDSANLRIISNADAGGRDYLQFVGNHQTGDIHAFVEPLRRTWWQAVVVRSGTNASLFRNGSILTNSTISATLSNSPAIWLGRHICPGYPIACPGSYPLVGGIDEVRLYNRAFSAQEVRQLHQYEKNPLPSMTIAVKTVRLTLFLAPGTTNQLESSTVVNVWTPYGPPFVATNSVLYQDVEVFESQRQYFRVGQLIP